MMANVPLKVGSRASAVLDKLSFDLRAFTYDAVGLPHTAMIHSLGIVR